MRTNLLKLNDSKTGFLVTGTKQQLRKIEDIEIKIGHNTIGSAPVVRNLGFYMDSELKNNARLPVVALLPSNNVPESEN